MPNILSAAAFSAILVVGIGFSTVASAQSPSVLQTIEALKPRPGTSRGSRPAVAPPSDGSTSTVTAAPSAHAPGATPTQRPAAVAAAPAGRPATADADAPSIDITVLFANGSADLQPAAVQSLQTLGQALASPDLSSSRFRIEGHTDTVGTKDGNRALSARRAAAVVDFLTHKFPIDPMRLESVGMGEDALRIPTGDQVSEPRNRRVRVVNITG